jgi:hypothetical protein
MVTTPPTGCPQLDADSRTRTTFDTARLTPEICKEHVSVRVHCVAPVSAPFMVKAPTKYE